MAFVLDIDFESRYRRGKSLKTDALVIIGGGRYVVVRPGQAEIAFVIIDTYQAQGIGTLLMRHLGALARDAGLKELIAEAPQKHCRAECVQEVRLPVRLTASLSGRSSGVEARLAQAVGPVGCSPPMPASREQSVAIAAAARFLPTYSFLRSRSHIVAASLNSRSASRNRAGRKHPRGNVVELELCNERPSTVVRRRCPHYRQRLRPKSPRLRIAGTAVPSAGCALEGYSRCNQHSTWCQDCCAHAGPSPDSISCLRDQDFDAPSIKIQRQT
jgi:hypothetical protein